MNKLYSILATLLLFSLSSLVSGSMQQCTEKDWSLTAKIARETQVPILVLFTAVECSYCEKLKHEVLEPLFLDDHENRLAVVREIDINSGGKMTDFDGDSIRSRRFKDRYKVFATPTLMILDNEGSPLTGPIIGYNSVEQYQTLLESALEKSRMELRNAELP
ncbi:MAG: thioredoxin fold domain-containing protein [Pseudomonadota bacterium]